MRVSIVPFHPPLRQRRSLLGIGNFGLHLLRDRADVLEGHSIRLLAMKRTLKAISADADAVAYYRSGCSDIADSLQRLLAGTTSLHVAFAAGAPDASTVGLQAISAVSKLPALVEVHVVATRPFSWEDRSVHQSATHVIGRLGNLAKVSVHVLDVRHLDPAPHPQMLQHLILDDLTYRAAQHFRDLIALP